MINETYYKITVSQFVKETKEVNDFQKIYDDKHPLLQQPNPPEQYGYRKVLRDTTTEHKILEQKIDTIDIERILKAINKGL